MFDMIWTIQIFSNMGSNQGVVWNDSNLPIQYCIYGAFQEISVAKVTRSLSPKIDLKVREGSFNLDGFEQSTEVETNPKYSEAFVEVPAGRHSSVGLCDLRMKEHRISLRVKVGPFVKYVVKDVVIKSIKDLRLKIRYDLSVKNLGDDETKGLVQMNEQKSGMGKDREMLHEKMYAQTLQSLQAMAS